MRRTLLLMATTMTLAVLVIGGVAWALTFTCTTNPCVGTPQADNITGTTGGNEINAKAGDDRVEGRGGGDLIHGRSGDDTLIGDGDDTSDDAGDELFGESGADRLVGEAFSNVYHGGSGPDDIDARFGGAAVPPVEQIFAGPGNDSIRANDDAQDIIRCGAGTDTVVNSDSHDTFPDQDCEAIN